uniref:Uncharacterized protein n=1 Tax=Anguilla anguilla TaxID=7936 RepID=A0A0E9ULU4_ANGAN
MYNSQLDRFTVQPTRQREVKRGHSQLTLITR